MKLKRNLMIGANIFAAGTLCEAIPAALRAQIPASEFEGEPEAPPPEVMPEPVTPPVPTSPPTLPSPERPHNRRR